MLSALANEADELSAAIFEKLAGHELLAADVILDNVRRILWLAMIADVTGQQAADVLPDDEEASDLASSLHGIGLKIANAAISYARAALWEAARQTPMRMQ